MERFLYTAPRKEDIKLNVWLAYPAIESFAMASLGYLSIFQMLDMDRELFVERIYQDSTNALIKKEDVDCIGFSMSFEIDIFNVIKMLEKYNISKKAKDRKENDPIVFAGGIVLMSNPKPYEEFFDFISIGEKVCLKEAFELLKRKNEFSKDELLEKLSQLDGIYVPKYKKDCVKITRDEIDKPVFTPILSDKSFFKDTFVIELERGCPKKCNFCLASWLNLPVRFASYNEIIKAIDLGLEYTDKLALLGAYVAGHPDFDKILEHIAKKCEQKPIELSISSLRADLTDENLIKALVKCNQHSATIALEAGSQRLRDYINKNLSNEQVLKTVELVQLGGLKAVKIYAIIGLPTETDEDIEELIQLLSLMKQNAKKNSKITGSNFDITLSVSTFVPKPNTPFEFAKRENKKSLENKIKYLKKTFHKLGVDFRATSVEWDIIQSVLSRYNEPLTDFLIEVVQKGANLGAFKQTWREYFKKGLLQSLDDCAENPFNNIKAPEWGFIDANILKSKLQMQERPDFKNL